LTIDEFIGQPVSDIQDFDVESELFFYHPYGHSGFICTTNIASHSSRAGDFYRSGKIAIIYFIVFSIFLFSWLGLWDQSIVYPALYWIGGGIILF